MPKLEIVSKATHATRRWRRYDTYAFASKDAVAGLVVQELQHALLHMPIAFIPEGEQFVPVAVLGLQPGQNLFVNPAKRWTGGYIPAAYRGYPFSLANTPDGQRVLVVDEESGLVNDAEGEAFFGEEDRPAKALQDVIDFVSQLQGNRDITLRICKVLSELQLIQPWPIIVQGSEGERRVEGLYCIDENAMNALPAEAFEALRQSGALPVAYCQLLSMQHLPSLVDAYQKAAQRVQATSADELNLAFLSNSDTISFGGL